MVHISSMIRLCSMVHIRSSVNLCTTVHGIPLLIAFRNLQLTHRKAGGGVLALGNVIISNCRFISNKAINGAGGGVCGGLNTEVVIYNSYFEDNEANV